MVVLFVGGGAEAAVTAFCFLQGGYLVENNLIDFFEFELPADFSYFRNVIVVYPFEAGFEGDFD
jgi:hypothetical protein